jgi:Uma2 family endonuclease
MEPQGIQWTVEEYDRMVELGLFGQRNVELIGGEIVEMPNQGPGHYVALDKSGDCLRTVFGPGYWVRTQAPLALGGDGEPNPDVSVVEGKRDDYLDRHPRDALLVVEASDSTLLYDRGRKGSLFARAKIPDYWIINLVDRQLEVRRKPVKDSRQPYGYGYKDLIVLGPDEYVSPLAAPQARIKVADLLP